MKELTLIDIINEVYDTLPEQIDKTPKGDFEIRAGYPTMNLKSGKPEDGESLGYFLNEEFNLKIAFRGKTELELLYVSEDGFDGEVIDFGIIHQSDGKWLVELWDYEIGNGTNKEFSNAVLIGAFSKTFGWIEEFED